MIMIMCLKISSYLKCTEPNLGHRVYFKDHPVLFSEEDLLLFPNIFYLLMCVGGGGEGRSGSEGER